MGQLPNSPAILQTIGNLQWAGLPVRALVIEVLSPTTARYDRQVKRRWYQRSLTVGDLEASAAWYCDALGFVIDRRHQRDGQLVAVSLRAGAVRILLAQDDGARGTIQVISGCAFAISFKAGLSR
jgi:hypothetical protein